MKGALMDQDFAGIEPLVYESRIGIPYNWWAGDTATKFFTGLSSERVFYATRCDACNKTFLPPRKTCPLCFAKNLAWKPLAPKGAVTTFTVARRKLAALGDAEPPVFFALIKLDGADTAIAHRLGNVAEKDLAAGLRVRAVFAPEPKGGILDVLYFEPDK
ncbi:MAG: OB-fold domain-containing protein [Thermodesulfobacteriota bacterium]